MLTNLPHPCVGDDPGGSETRGDLSPPLTRWRQYCGRLRGWRGADIQPIERREQRFLQWPQVCRQHHKLRWAWSSAGHRLQGEWGRFPGCHLFFLWQIWLHSPENIRRFRTPTLSCGTSSMNVDCTGWEAIKTSSHRPCSSKTRTSWWRGNWASN